MAVSSNTLFHFTDKIETIEAILNSKGFWPRYCIEFGWEKDFAVPMCCFCDIPLSAIKPHTEFYGNYGLGMSKEWAINNGMSPVMYHIRKSIMAENIKKMMKNENLDKETKYKQMALMKVYKGVNYRKDNAGVYKQKRDFLYYDEREWRYIPDVENYEQLFVKVQDKVKFVKEKAPSLNLLTQNKKCMFDVGDVKYIFVKDDGDIQTLCARIDKMDVYDAVNKEKLKTKIITYKLIVEDI